MKDMIDVIIEDKGWETALPDARALAAACAAAAARAEPAVNGEIALLMTNANALQSLNAKFRGVDKPTNVLAFPNLDGDFLGDVALALETCRREADEQGVALRDHAAHLIVHGILHLVGYDHEQGEQAEAMERREAEILETLGIKDPYADAVEKV